MRQAAEAAGEYNRLVQAFPIPRLGVLAILLAGASLCLGADRKLSAVIIDGVNNHDWAAGTAAIQAILQGSGRFTVDVSTHPKLPDFGKYDVVISNFNGGHTEKGVRWPAARNERSKRMSAAAADWWCFMRPITPSSSGPRTTT